MPCSPPPPSPSSSRRPEPPSPCSTTRGNRTRQTKESAGESPSAGEATIEDKATPPGRPTDKSSPARTAGSGTGGGSDGGTSGGGSGDGGATGGGGTATTQAPVCHSIGGGKYNCEVWRTATSYTASGAEAGELGAGTNYFYCQQNLGRRETYGEWTNVWWAKTDDDSGNTNVYVSDVYIKGGDNDEPVPGLPVC